MIFYCRGQSRRVALRRVVMKSYHQLQPRLRKLLRKKMGGTYSNYYRYFDAVIKIVSCGVFRGVAASFRQVFAAFVSFSPLGRSCRKGYMFVFYTACGRRLSAHCDVVF